MAKSFLNLFLTLAMLSGCSALFDDDEEELHPERFKDLGSLDLEDHYQVVKNHILESFGAFGCTSCPDAEERLSPYIHPGNSQYNPNLVVVNYHAPFSSPIKDNWETEGTARVYNLYGYESLPQVKLNGSNQAYGFLDKDLPASLYGNLLNELEDEEVLSWFEIRIDSSTIQYGDDFSIVFTFSGLNRGYNPISGLSFKVLAVKNQPVSHPKWPGVNWEVIVVQVTSEDEEGEELSLSRLEALTRVTYRIKLQAPDESQLHIPPLPPEEVEKIKDYALIVIAFNGGNIVQNVASYQYNPVSSLK